MTKFKRRTELPDPVHERMPRETLRHPTLVEIQSLARDKTEAALNVLAAIMYRETANPFARVAAANAILDRGWGRPVQPLATNAAPLELVHRIERVIIHPDQHQAIADQRDTAGALGVPQSILPQEEIAR